MAKSTTNIKRFSIPKTEQEVADYIQWMIDNNHNVSNYVVELIKADLDKDNVKEDLTTGLKGVRKDVKSVKTDIAELKDLIKNLNVTPVPATEVEEKVSKKKIDDMFSF